MRSLQEVYGHYYLYAGLLSGHRDTEMQPGRPLPHSHPSVQPVVHLGATQCSRKGAIWPWYEITTDLQAFLTTSFRLWSTSNPCSSQRPRGSWWEEITHHKYHIPFTNTGMLLSEPRAGFGCDCLHVAAASPSPKCHGDPCQTGSLAESSSTVLVLLILDNASCFKPLGVITSLQSSILMGRNPLVIPTLPGRPTSARLCFQKR